ncbi:MAG: VWA domain-containing protein [Candidatus Sulfopaludibacter sp.]|nr:VWA domain-containing protein [Candidatus Sulfopaludibacter sp.]
MQRLWGLVVLTALAQTPAPTGYVLRFDVDLVQVDVVVTDSHGNHVPSLTADDFEVRQDGKPQKITHFSYVGGDPTAGAQKRHAEAPIPAPEPTATGVHRTIVFLLDDVTMSFFDFTGARKAVKQYVDDQMQPDDMVALMRTSRGSGAMQVFTSDSRWLSNMLDRMIWHPWALHERWSDSSVLAIWRR